MNILFCNEGFIVDGVASYNLYLSAALRQAGYNVAVIGRWAGFKGFQKRHKDSGVKVIQDLSIAAESTRLVKQAVTFKPDILITDSRRSYPLAKRIRQKTGAKVITVFHDPPQLDRTGNRSIRNLIGDSNAWITSEKPIFDELKKIQTDVPMYWIQRPITGMVQSSPLPPRDPFHVLCLGRLSRWKSPGIRIIIEKALQLKQVIPSLLITVIGGGHRRFKISADAIKANSKAGQRFVRIVGTQTNPQSWITQATVVCACATSAIEAILCQRPVIAFSGFWMGLVTPENLENGVRSHFGERSGEFYTRENPDVVINSIRDLYLTWKQDKMAEQTKMLRQKLAPAFDSLSIAATFTRLFSQL